MPAKRNDFSIWYVQFPDFLPNVAMPCFWGSVALSVSSLSLIMWYVLLTEKTPLSITLYINVSSWFIRLISTDKMEQTSSLVKIRFTKSWSHHFVLPSMSWSTIASSCKIDGWDYTLYVVGDLIHLSFQILTFFPFPTLQISPSLITSHDPWMLFQANDGFFPKRASKTEQSG